MPIGGTAFYGQNQSPRLTTQYINQSSRRGDPGPGVNLGGQTDMVFGGTIGFSGGIVQPYTGFVGGKLTITGPWAAQFADPTVGPVYGGIYQYVQFDKNAVTPNTPGAMCFWLDETNYIVTPDFVGGVSFKPAGIIINPDIPSYYDFIQIAGVGMGWFTAGGAVGNFVQFTPGTPPAPTYLVTGGTIGATFVGVAVMNAPVANAMSPVEINFPLGLNF